MPYIPERSLLAVVLSLMITPALADEVSPAAGSEDPGTIRVLLVAGLETTLSSQMAGTLGEFKATLGQAVAKDAVLARFDCAEAQARTRVATAELAMARQNLEAKRNLRKLDAVGDLEVAVANTEVQKADGARALAQAQSGYCVVQAPFAGRVAKVHAKPFQTVPAGTPLFDLVSDGALKVRLNVPSNLLPRLQANQALDVDILETGKRYPAHVSAINARVDAVAQTVELEARLDAAHPELIAGMSGTARFPSANE
ncbi:efflux RND transporter periplasmic adaptor subunit [Pseudomonas sp. NPDC090755]|uniref:efflux RND transporter periplasmic adaptor subunit n=1 Tax=Pseudomonas sp. NPDC090755 TaxID=3364481 RepID=UPI00383BB000